VLFGALTGIICALIALLIVKFVYPVVEKGFNKLSDKKKKTA
jgi:hypothetical protein